MANTPFGEPAAGVETPFFPGRPAAAPTIPQPPGGTQPLYADGTTAGGRRVARRRVGQALDRFEYEGLRAGEMEQAGIDRAIGLTGAALPDLFADTLTERDIADLYAGRLEEIGRGKVRDMQSVRDYLGMSGLEGAAALDLGMQAEQRALQAITNAQRGIRERVSDYRAADKIRRLNATQMAAAQFREPVSQARADTYAGMTSAWNQMLQGELAYAGARKGGNAARQGALIGGGLNILGSLGAGLLG